MVNKIDDKLCLICGGVGNSRENKVKKSDTEKIIPKVSQKNVAIMHRGFENGEKIRISTYRSGELMFRSAICQKCNNQLLQPYDLAWDKLSKFLISNQSAIVENKKFNLKDVYPAKSPKNSKFLQLFFINKLAFYLNDETDDFFDLIHDLTKSVRNSSVRQDVFLDFFIKNEGLAGVVGLSQLHVESSKLGTQIVFQYYIENITVQVTYYSGKIAPTLKPIFGWTPFNRSKVIKINRERWN